MLRSTHDYVIVDTPPGFTPEVIASIDSSSHVCMVGMLDSLSLKNTKLGLETLELMGYDRERITLRAEPRRQRVGITQDDVDGDRRPGARRARAERPGHPALGQRGHADRRCQAALGGRATFRTLAELYTPTEARPTAQTRPPALRGRKGVMELHERLATAPAASQPRQGETRSRRSRTAIHMAVIGDLGPQLFNVDMDPIALRERVIDRHPRRSSRRGRGSRATTASGWRRDRRRHPRPRAARAAACRRQRHRDHGQRPVDVWVERQGRLYETTVRFTDESHLRRIINKMVAQVGRRIDESSPMVDARLPDGSRVNAVHPAAVADAGRSSRSASSASSGSTLDDLVRLGTLTHGDGRVPRSAASWPS